MNTGRAPRHCTLYGVASLRAMSAASASLVTRSWSRAASLSIENVHSYGYETNGRRSCRSAATHPPSGSADCRASRIAASATVVSTTSPASVNRSSRPLAANASQSVAPSAVRPRTIVAVQQEHPAVRIAERPPVGGGAATRRWARRAQSRGTASPCASTPCPSRRRRRRRRPGPGEAGRQSRDRDTRARHSRLFTSFRSASDSSTLKADCASGDEQSRLDSVNAAEEEACRGPRSSVKHRLNGGFPKGATVESDPSRSSSRAPARFARSRAASKGSLTRSTPGRRPEAGSVRECRAVGLSGRAAGPPSWRAPAG